MDIIRKKGENIGGKIGIKPDIELKRHRTESRPNGYLQVSSRAWCEKFCADAHRISGTVTDGGDQRVEKV